MQEQETVKWHRYNTGSCANDGRDCPPDVTPASNYAVHTSEVPQHTDNIDHLVTNKSNGAWLKPAKAGESRRVTRQASDGHMPLVAIITPTERNHKGSDVSIRDSFQSKLQREKRGRSSSQGRSNSSQGRRRKPNYWGNESSSQRGKQARSYNRSRSPSAKDNSSASQGNTRGTITLQVTTFANNFNPGDEAEHMEGKAERTSRVNSQARQSNANTWCSSSYTCSSPRAAARENTIIS